MALMDKLAVIVLAAGLGKRMGSELPKVLAQTSEKTLIQHVLVNALHLKPDLCVVVTGHKRELVEQEISRHFSEHSKLIKFAEQEQQLGTGHAVKAALPALGNFKGTVLILYGDVPLVKVATLKSLLELHHKSKSTLSLLSFNLQQQNNYGRVVRDAQGKFVLKIIEAKDCSAEESKISELNSGIYAIETAFLAPAIENLKNHNAQSEFYLTDIVERASSEGQTVTALMHAQSEEFLGVNDRAELAMVNQVIMKRRIEDLIKAGVQVEDPATLYVDASVKIESGAKIGPNVQLRGATTIAAGVTFEGSAYVQDCKIEKDALIRFGVRMEESVIGSKASVGPFAHLRKGTLLGSDVKVGNFVETKNATLEHGVKAGHLTYLGDAAVGENSNIGAGTITCNYDGQKKHQTTIGKNVFIGSNSALVAPLKINDGAYVGAGSVITKEVAAESLTLTRSPLKVKAGWAKNKQSK